ncbi:MAG: hypothetical protein R3249_03345 [Nitriliruptorales bacterium]|nr:hypothetical protein [Nitriliruptorales bacterium]
MARVESSILIDAAPGAIRSLTDDLASCAEHTGGRLSMALQDKVVVTGSTIKGTLDLGDKPIAFTAQVSEAGIERLAWAATESPIALSGEIAAKQVPEGTRLVFSLETGPIGGMPGSRAEREAIRRLQDLTNDYVNGIRNAIAAAPIDLAAEERIEA